MNGKLAAFFTGIGMTVQKNDAYGEYRGYEMSAKAVLATSATDPSLVVHVAFYADGEKKRMIFETLKSARLKFFRHELTPYGICLGLNDWTAGRLAGRMQEILDTVVDAVAAAGGLGRGYCPYCGKPLDGAHETREVDGFRITLDSACVADISAVIEAENREFDAAPNNCLRGFFGALIGGIVGGAIAALLYAIGFISALSAVVSVLLGAFLYRKFGGKPNKLMLIIVAAVTVVCMALAIFIVYIVASGMAADELGLDMGAFEVFAYCMEDAEFRGLFILDLVLVLVFAVVGLVLEIITLWGQIRRKKKF